MRQCCCCTALETWPPGFVTLAGQSPSWLAGWLGQAARHSKPLSSQGLRNFALWGPAWGYALSLGAHQCAVDGSVCRPLSLLGCLIVVGFARLLVLVLSTNEAAGPCWPGEFPWAVLNELPRVFSGLGSLCQRWPSRPAELASISSRLGAHWGGLGTSLPAGKGGYHWSALIYQPRARST